ASHLPDMTLEEVTAKSRSQEQHQAEMRQSITVFVQTLHARSPGKRWSPPTCEPDENTSEVASSDTSMGEDDGRGGCDPQERSLPHSTGKLFSRAEALSTPSGVREGARSPNRWVIAIAACGMQLLLGSVYAWSVFLGPVMASYHVSQLQANLPFSIVQVVLGVTAGFGGSLNSRFGPRTIAITAALFYGIGTGLAGLGAPNIALLCLTYGGIGGIGLGLGYIVAVAMLIKWFPDKRGLIMGLAVAGFGAGAAIIGPMTATLLLPLFRLKGTFLILGATYAALITLAAQFYHTSPRNYRPVGWRPPESTQGTCSTRNYSLKEALATPAWHVLWVMLALNITVSAAVISVASPLAQQFTHVSTGVASILVMMIALFNGAGRIFWGWLSDRIGRTSAFLGLFILQLIAFASMPLIHRFALITIPAALIGFCAGGGFGTMPAFTADYFGPKNTGTIYGVMLTAWSAGGIIGPVLITTLDYRTALYLMAAVMAGSCALPFLARALAPRQEESSLTASSGRLAQALDP
ncbi:MAG TPA: OFA family MFS transporter, partial [Ktedonosporobacter sp.]|nr:OFA family MFS transporter [Ktedonosporobacter sp.]